MMIPPWRRARTMLAGLIILSYTPAMAQAVTPAEDQPLRGCATHRFVMDLRPQGPRAVPSPGGQAASVASLLRTQAATLHGRTHVTPHFAVHYTLAPTVNRPVWDPQSSDDAQLRARVDSLLATLPPQASASERDSLLHARLDLLGASHPRYILRAGEHFERAWRHYDSLGMRMPDSSPSQYFKVPSHGRVSVDVANIGTVIPSYEGPYYGLAFPPANGQGSSLLIENDFLYNARYNTATGVVTGTPIRSLHKGETYRDYSVDWDMGLKVTASHEFYHAVQYQYTPSLDGYHAWYELSATGMEERLAPEVNDYFQYLPFTLQRHHDVPLTSAGTLANYGNAIFHVFLTRRLGEGFDVTLWEHLADTNHLGKALIKTAGSEAAWDSLFNDYAAALSLAGTPGATGSSLAFSPDMSQWPVPHFDDAPVTGGAALRLPATTFRLVRAPDASPGIALLPGLSQSRRVDSSTAGYHSTVIHGDAVSLAKGDGATRSTAVFAHSGFTGTRTVLLSAPGPAVSPASNPLKRTQGPLYTLAPAGGTQDSLRVVSESGRRVATVPVDPSGTYWIWDLREDAEPARIVPPGLYWLRAGSRPPASVLLLP